MSAFGWLQQADVPRYEAGQRRFGGGWITAAEDARRRQRISAGWRVRTDHYMVTTNDCLEGGVQLATRLELFHQICAPAVRRLLPGHTGQAAPAR